MLESIISTTSTFDVGSGLIAVAVALVYGFLIGLMYMRSCRKQGYSKNFIIALIIIPAVVAGIILMIGSDIAKALSMGGAFALVRFRSAPGTAKDIAAIFFSMAVGLACGLGYIFFAGLFALLIAVVFLVISLTPFADRNAGVYQLKVTCPDDLNYSEAFDSVFSTYTVSAELKRVRTTHMGTMFENTYAVKLKDGIQEKKFIDALRTRNGNLPVVLSELSDSPETLNSNV
ncbi:MAG: DUF4956 domain-containing protein [Lachnospiraceae bacterium]|jgi:uncharacterized membrane protein YhiD involved in acid resistance